MNKCGIQFQQIGEAQWSLVRATWPHCLKMLDGGKSLEMAREWRGHRPDGVLVLRFWTPDSVTLAELPARTADALRAFDGFQAVGGRIVLEVPINEKFHTDPLAFAALAEASVPAARTITEAGFTPGVLVTSEGNPPGPRFGADYFLQPRVLECMQVFRGLGAIWCPHGYSHPPAASDEPYHATRPAWITAQLPEAARLNYLYGESGCDGGTDQPGQKKGVGWTGYFESPGAYAAWYRAKARTIAQDPLCVGAAVFLSGFSDKAWESFDVRDEVDFRWIFTEAVDGPPITWLTPPTPEVPMAADWYPPATRRPITVNYTPGRAGKQVALIVDHIADGLGSPWAWFNTDRGEQGSSAHFWISKAGGVEQYRPLSDTCWANGPVCQPDTSNPIVAKVTAAGQVNAQTVAIEHEGKPGDAFPVAQVAASRALHRWLSERYGLALDRTHVVGHYQIDKCTRANCPGISFPWTRILQEVPMPDTPDQLRDQTYALAQQMQDLGPKWQAAGYPQHAEYVRTQGEAIKRTIVIGKGER